MCFPQVALTLALAFAFVSPADAQHSHDMVSHEHHGPAAMAGLYGPYPLSREASGTAWQPDAAEHHGLHLSRGPWMVMLHGAVDLVLTAQGGERGDDDVYAAHMIMGMARRPWGPGVLGVRTMLSLEPATIGKEGYPLLLQSGETGDGRTHLIDRQHPHDFFMELAGSYSISSGDRAVFVYGGLPGEPALGPPAFMHRLSGMSLPEAPITHHWLDSSHITFGVLTAGVVVDRLKVEVSGFRGREPDEQRWDIERPKLDSHSVRVSFQPSAAWSLQISAGKLRSPEQLEPDVDTDRTTASAMHAMAWEGGRWESTLAWGRNRNRPGRILDAFAAETALRLGERSTWFGRIERVEKDELFEEPSPLEGRAFHVGKVSLGFRFDALRTDRMALGFGAMGTVSGMPRPLVSAYGSRPTSGVLFGRLEIR
jgi:hypothetical protein